MPTEPRVYRTPEEAQQLIQRTDERIRRTFEAIRDDLEAQGEATDELSIAEIRRIFLYVYQVMVEHNLNMDDPECWRMGIAAAARAARSELLPAGS